MPGEAACNMRLALALNHGAQFNEMEILAVGIRLHVKPLGRAVVEIHTIGGGNNRAATKMVSTELTRRHGSRLEIGKAFFGAHFDDEKVANSRSYFEYYFEELDLLRSGIKEQTWQIRSLAAQTYEDIFYIVETLRNNGSSQRPKIRDLLKSSKARFQHSDDVGLNRSINLAIRLWLMINVQEPPFEGIRHQATCIEWNDEAALQEFVRKLFPKSRWEITARSSRLGPHFTAAFMQRVCGLTIEWTTSLHDHLRLDRKRKELRIFPYKCHLQAMIDCHRSVGDDQKILIPLEVLNETKLSLDLLFPFWDDQTMKLLETEKQTFHEHGPFEATKTSTLLDFDHWRDRLLEIHEEIFESPPVSWAQLWRDRRNPQQFWTFWVALMILLLTVVSTGATVLQAWASVKALG